MRYLLWNLFLAFVWAASQGAISTGNLIVGFLLGYAVLWLCRCILPTQRYTTRAARLIEFCAFFLWELLVANLRLAYDVLTPHSRMRPAILALPLDAQTDLEILLLANFISLTPGTLSLDVSPDRRFLYVHTMYPRDAETEKRRLKSGFEQRLLQLLR